MYHCPVGAIKSVAVSADSRYFASGSYDKSVRVWRTRDAALMHELTGNTFINIIEVSRISFWIHIYSYTFLMLSKLAKVLVCLLSPPKYTGLSYQR